MKANKGRRTRGHRRDERQSEEWGMGNKPKSMRKKSKRQRIRIRDYMMHPEVFDEQFDDNLDQT